jgi:hypothetical protein
LNDTKVRKKDLDFLSIETTFFLDLFCNTF